MNKEDKKVLFEEYKLYVQTAENNSNRRQTANNFFLSFNSILIFGISYMVSRAQEPLLIILLSFVGIIASLLWITTIKSYKQLNTGKFKIIHNLEKHLPYAVFKKEWDYLENGQNKSKYIKLTVVEKGVPYAFMVLYVILFLVFLVNLFYNKLNIFLLK